MSEQKINGGIVRVGSLPIETFNVTGTPSASTWLNGAKVWRAIAESDVTNLVADLAALGAGASSFLGKASVVATSNVTQSGSQTVDGVAGPHRIVCTAQISAVDNGIFDWDGIGGHAWTRSTYLTGQTLNFGNFLFIDQGVAYGQTFWMISSPDGTVVDTGNWNWQQVQTNLANAVYGILPAADMPALTGDVTSSAGAVATTLATVNSNVGSFTNANITVNAKGLITAASNGSGGGSVPIEHISGCNLIYSTTTQIQVNTGTVGLANGSSWTVASIISNSPTLAASTKYYVYLTSASTVSVTTTAPSSNYAGSAWNDGTTSHRYVGMFVTDASSHINKFRRVGNRVTYKVDVTASQFTLLSATATVATSTSQSVSALVPPTAYRALLSWQVGVAIGVLFGASDGTTPTTTTGSNFITASSGITRQDVTVDLDTSQAFLFCNTSIGGQNTVNLMGYDEDL